MLPGSLKESSSIYHNTETTLYIEVVKHLIDIRRIIIGDPYFMVLKQTCIVSKLAKIKVTLYSGHHNGSASFRTQAEEVPL